jgi:NTE family protein
VALVIGSGSVKCAAALGAYRLLQREGIGVDMVVGCSAGSVFASVIALGYDADTCAAMASSLWTSDLTKQPDRRSLLKAAFPRLFGFDAHWGLRNDAPVMRRLQETYGDRTFADARIPLFITATDFNTGEQVVLRAGRLVDAIRASVAIPFAFRPHAVDGRLLIDGFMSDPLPVGVAIKEGANVIVAVGFESPYQTRITSAGRFAFQLSSIMTNNLLKASFAFHGLAHHSEVIPVIPRFEQRIRLFDTAKMPYVIDEGERAMEEQMPYLRRLLEAAPAS